MIAASAHKNLFLQFEKHFFNIVSPVQCPVQLIGGLRLARLKKQFLSPHRFGERNKSHYLEEL
jgi:hypothetical protein